MVVISVVGVIDPNIEYAAYKHKYIAAKPLECLKDRPVFLIPPVTFENVFFLVWHFLKAAVGKLLKNFGNKNTTGGKLDKKSSSSYLDGLLAQLKSGKKVLCREKEESSSLDELVRQLERRERGKDRAALATPTLIASPESFLEKLLTRNRKRPSSRRSNQRSRLDRLLASIHGNDYDYDFNFEDDFDFLESPRHLDFFEDDYRFRSRGSSSLNSALRSSQRLEDDLEYLLRKLERERK